MKLFPKTDFEKLRGWLDKRAASLKRERLPHEGFWRTLAEHYEPDIGRALQDDTEEIEDQAAAPRDTKILNSTPRTELRRMAAAMKSGTANESRQWFRLRIQNQNSAQIENPALVQWMDGLTRGMSELLDQSNAYGAIGQLFLHTGLFGNGTALVFGNHPEDILDVRVIDTGAYWIGSTRGGRINVLLRRVNMTAREILEEFGESRAPQSVVDACKEGRDEQRMTLWHLVCPNTEKNFPDLDQKMEFASVWWTDSKTALCGDQETNGIVDIRGFTYNPILCPRWEVTSGVYGTGPGRIGMPDVLMLYRLEKDSLKGIAQRVDPPLAAPDGMEGRTINTYPGGVTYYPESMGRDRSLHSLIDLPTDVSSVEQKIQQVEMRLRRVFFADLFNAILNVANQSATQMTARQVDEMSGEKISLLGPVLTNLNHGLFDPLISAVFGVMLEAGLVPEPPESLKGAEWQAEYVSTLHMRQQEEARLGGIMRFSQFAAGILQSNPDSAMKIDFDQMLDEAAQALAVPGSVIRSDKDVERMRAARAEALQEQQQAATMAEMGRQAPGYADAAKKLSETPTGGTTALEALMGANQQTTGGML